jgi:hypothetical protein
MWTRSSIASDRHSRCLEANREHVSPPVGEGSIFTGFTDERNRMKFREQKLSLDQTCNVCKLGSTARRLSRTNSARKLCRSVSCTRAGVPSNKGCGDCRSPIRSALQESPTTSSQPPSTGEDTTNTGIRALEPVAAPAVSCDHFTTGGSHGVGDPGDFGTLGRRWRQARTK